MFRIWGGWILNLHLDYVAGCTDPLIYLFELTHKYPVDDQCFCPGSSIVRACPKSVTVLPDR